MRLEDVAGSHLGVVGSHWGARGQESGEGREWRSSGTRVLLKCYSDLGGLTGAYKVLYGARGCSRIPLGVLRWHIGVLRVQESGEGVEWSRGSGGCGLPPSVAREEAWRGDGSLPVPPPTTPASHGLPQNRGSTQQSAPSI